MVIVALANAVAILRINQLHRRAAFTRRRMLAVRYLSCGMSAGCAMFLILGWSTGALPEMVAPLVGTADASAPGIEVALWSTGIALAFGIAHFNGVPNGIVGVVMAGCWGLILAYLRHRTGGMLATYLAHLVADTTIIAVLLPLALTG